MAQTSTRPPLTASTLPDDVARMEASDRVSPDRIRHAIALVEAFDPGIDMAGRVHRDRVLQLLRTATHPFSRRAFDPGHVTASAVVLSPDRSRVLLVRHRSLGRWLQPGGHVEPDDGSVTAAAHRESSEETGVVVDGAVAPVLVGVDVHAIPPAGGEPAHEHHDLMFHFQAAGTPVGGAEGLDLMWCALGELAERGVDAALRRAVSRARFLDAAASR